MPLQLNPKPTFKAKVNIPVPGEDKQELEFEFLHMGKAEFAKFAHSGELEKMTDVDVVLKLACGWGLPDAFNRENLEAFLNNYHGAAQAIWLKYGSELSGARLGN